MVSKKSKIISTGIKFNKFIDKSSNQLVLLSDFLENGHNSSVVYSLPDFIDSKNIFTKKAEDLVFHENSGTLVDPKGNKIIKWK